ncbi:hypothetical protein MTYP_00116 [Methylophilaceae bacterium]|nr:hypothetical protein MTYP_00116 [Methylophilaceae bacterium]
MLLVYLSLILVPTIAFLGTRQFNSKHTWLLTGVTFGAVAYPFFASLSLPLVYMGSVGHAIVNITNPIAIFHRAPGKLVYFFINGHPLFDREFINPWLFGINAIVWGLVYGAMGWYVDRDPARNQKKIPLLLLAIPVLYKVVTFSTILLPAATEISDQIVHSKNYGTICRQVIDAEPNTDVWIGIGSLEKGYAMLRAVEGKQFCHTVALAKAPFQVILAAGGSKWVALDIPISGGGKTCIGLTPAHKDASPQDIDWSAKVIDCELTHPSSGTR